MRQAASLIIITHATSLAALGCAGSSDSGPPPGSGGASSTSTQNTSAGGPTNSGSTLTSGGPTTNGATTGSATSGGVPCTNVRPTGTEWDEATCDQWASETSECNNDWMVDNDYCNESCGRCSPGNASATTGSTTTGSATTGNTTSSSTTGGNGGCDRGTTHSGGTQYCSSSQGNAGNGYSYEYWSDGTGSGCMTVFGDEAAFSANWSNVGDFLARVGLKYDETRTHDQIGTFSSDFAFTKSGNETTYIGFYGWSSDPLIEYYIIEDWMGDWRPSFTEAGTITVDGGTYDVYTNVRTNAPSIRGTQTFTQYYSVRREGRQCGHTSISEHFLQWESLGLHLGNLYEVMLLVEGLNDGSGELEFTKGTVVVQ